MLDPPNASTKAGLRRMTSTARTKAKKIRPSCRHRPRLSSRLLRLAADGVPNVTAMDRREAIARLPEAYQVALRLHAEGRNDDIADRLGIAPEAVTPLLRLADAKLQRLLSRVDASDHVGGVTEGNE
jgi:DNA-directed RNA polymerase specialized sigma24 family protein